MPFSFRQIRVTPFCNSPFSSSSPGSCGKVPPAVETRNIWREGGNGTDCDRGRCPAPCRKGPASWWPAGRLVLAKPAIVTARKLKRRPSDPLNEAMILFDYCSGRRQIYSYEADHSFAGSGGVVRGHAPRLPYRRAVCGSLDGFAMHETPAK